MVGLVVVLFVTAGAVLAPPETTSMVITAGTGVTAAGALLDAQRNAVEQGAGLLLRSDTQVREMQLVKDLITTRAAGYLARYEVLERKEAAGVHEVTIRAVLKLAPLAQDLLEVEAVAEKLGRPRLLVALAEEDRGRPSDRRPATLEIQKLLMAKGFDVIDGTQLARLTTPEMVDQALAGQPEALIALAVEQGVEVVIGGRVKARLASGAGTYTGRAEIEASAWQTTMAMLLAAGSLEVGARPERPGVTAFDADGAAHGALRSAATELLLGPEGLVAQILAAWLRSPAVVKLEVRAVPFTSRQAVIDAVRSADGVREVLMRLYRDEVLTLEVRADGTVPALLECLGRCRAGGKRLTITSVTGHVAQAELR